MKLTRLGLLRMRSFSPQAIHSLMPKYHLYMCGCWQALTFIKKGPWALGPWSWWRLNRITLSERSPNVARKLIFRAASEKSLSAVWFGCKSAVKVKIDLPFFWNVIFSTVTFRSAGHNRRITKRPFQLKVSMCVWCIIICDVNLKEWNFSLYW